MLIENGVLVTGKCIKFVQVGLYPGHLREGVRPILCSTGHHITTTIRQKVNFGIRIENKKLISRIWNEATVSLTFLETGLKIRN